MRLLPRESPLCLPMEPLILSNHSNVELTDTSSVRLLVDTVREEETVIRYLKECLCAIK